ncbi:MAG: formylglycine-generating enzyme family protein [Myxococcaceae bacterium]
MRFVPASAFKMGTAGDDPMRGFDERGLASVDVSGFCIDVYEYPNKRGGSPTVNVSWNDAKRLCEGKGKRLCSEAEWEKACKGPGNARFPYGNTFDPNACNTEDDTGEDRTLTAAGRFAKCRSGYGIADMSGNVAEWTSSAYATNADKTQKGGSFDRPDYAARCSARKNGSPAARSPEVGFRCCSDGTQ